METFNIICLIIVCAIEIDYFLLKYFRIKYHCIFPKWKTKFVILLAFICPLFNVLSYYIT